MLLDRADRDIYNARWLISPSGNPSNDELLDDMAAYHVQQGIENALKYALKMICGLDEAYKGYRTPRMMSLESWMRLCRLCQVPGLFRSAPG